MHAAGGLEQAGAVLQQAQRLSALCLAALAQHAPQLAVQLQKPRVGAAVAMAACNDMVAPTLEALLLLTAADSWKAALGPVAAAAATAQILASVVSAGLFGKLARIAAAACPEGAIPAAAGGRAVPSGEALVTALTVRYISQQVGVARCLQLRQQHRQHAALAAQVQQQSAEQALAQAGQQPAAQPPPGTQPPGIAADRQLPLLLCLPLLLRRLPTLQPVASRLWRQAVAALHVLAPADLATWLQQQEGQDAGAAGAGAALLGNLLEGAGAALKAEDAAAAMATRQPALEFVALASALLALLPQQPFFAGDSSDGASSSSQWVDEDEEEASVVTAAAAAVVPGAAKLPWDAGQLPSADLVAQLQLVSDGGLLRALVRAVLPLASAAAAAQLPVALPVQQRAADARRLCGLLQQLMAVPGQRQRVPVMLAFTAELVQRLWFSYLRPAQASPREWLVCGCVGGWE